MLQQQQEEDAQGLEGQQAEPNCNEVHAGAAVLAAIGAVSSQLTSLSFGYSSSSCSSVQLEQQQSMQLLDIKQWKELLVGLQRLQHLQKLHIPVHAGSGASCSAAADGDRTVCCIEWAQKLLPWCKVVAEKAGWPRP
jgi:hypothetical protein